MAMDTDILHEAGSHPEWNESFYFNFYDRELDICGFMRIGLKPNRNEKSMFCFLMMPDGSLVGMKGQQGCESKALEVKGLSYEKVVPEKKWKLTFNGAAMETKEGKTSPELLSFDLDFESLNPVFDYRECVDAKKVELSKSVASEHLEQFGRISGELVLGGRSNSIHGLGERDHSWGVREWTAPKMWIWLTCQFSERCAFNVTKLVVEGGEVDAGFFCANGKNYPLVKAEIDTAYNEEGGPSSLGMSLMDKNGQTYKAQAEVMRRAILPFEGREGKALSLLHEPLARYSYNGMTGYGIAEYLIRRKFQQ
jgi:hypothetical protein